MAILRIKLTVPVYERWKRAFDRDTTNRRGSGVVRYAIYRPIVDRTLVMLDLELGTAREAEALLVKMHRVWDGNQVGVAGAPEAWIIEEVEAAELRAEPEAGDERYADAGPE